ncbi:MAG: pitrilysin family protein [Bdellovibrionota bacterium]
MFSIEKRRLSNGLEVIFVPTPGMDVVALQGWIRFGSADEPIEAAGIAHLFEHLLFKGTETRGVGQIANDIENLGGDVNAFTTYDCTVMHLTLGKESADAGLEILADSLQNSIVDAEEFEREREVILEEIKRRNDNPGAAASDLLRSHLFGSHPYSRPVIGYSSVIEKISRDEVMKIYKTYYNANNLYLTLAGDFDIPETTKTLEKLFSKLQSGPGGSARAPIGGRASASEYRHHNTPDAHLSFAWRVPQMTHPMTPALDALALILGQGESSRLYDKLVLDKQLVRSVGSYSWSPRDTGAFEIHVKAPPGSTKNYNKILDNINSVLALPVTTRELEKVKANMIVQNAYSRETVDGLAERFGYAQAMSDDANFDFEYTKRINELSTEDLENAKKEFLNWDKVIATGILPKGEKLPLYIPPKKTFVKTAPRTWAGGVNKCEIGDYTILAKKVSHAPIVSLRWNALAGCRIESDTEAGTGSLWTRVLTEGAIDSAGKTWKQKEINALIDWLGASVSSSHGKGSSGISFDCLSKDFETLANLATAMVEEPLFEKNIIEAEKKRILTDIRSALESPGAVLSNMFYTKMFPKHSYGRDRFAEAKKIAKLTPLNLEKLHKKIFSQKQVISVVGDVDPESVFLYFEKHLENKKQKLSSELLKKKKTTHTTKPKAEVKTLDKEQSHIQLGFPTFDIRHEDRWALSGLSGLLSGQGGRLFIELRDKLSLCYSVGCSHFEGIDGGFFAFYIGTSPEKEEKALEAFHREIDKVINNGVTKDEWERARRFILGSKKIDDQRLSPQALELSLTELYGLGFEESLQFESRMKDLTHKEISEVAKKYLSQKNKEVLTTVRPKNVSK